MTCGQRRARTRDVQITESDVFPLHHTCRQNFTEQFYWTLIYRYVIRWYMSAITDLTKSNIGNCKFMHHATFWKYICAHSFEWSTRYIMPIIVSNCQHCDEQQFRNTVKCTLHDFLSSKVRFIHTSTVTESDSCSGKKIRVRLAYILFIVAGFEFTARDCIIQNITAHFTLWLIVYSRNYIYGLITLLTYLLLPP